MARTAASLRIDASEVTRRLDDLQEKGRNARPIWRRFAQYMRVRTDQTFKRLRTGGSFRGVTWDYFAPQYTRKTDGVQVPAWGGVPKLYGGGNVLGRLRPSGARLAYGDALMQDTGTLRTRAALVLSLRHDHLIMGTNLKYAPRQQRLRRFLFFETPRDVNQLLNIAKDHLLER